MGSGGSKGKSSKTGTKPDNNSKSTRALKISEAKQPIKNEKVTTLNLKSVSNDDTRRNNVNGSSNQNNNSKKLSETTNSSSKSGHISNNAAKKDLGKFESDSESEGEDIAEVLAATKRAQNNRVQEQNNYNTNKQQTSYPETYAQRLQREQYKQQPPGLIRQKTIYRNPEEWEVDENEVESFDVRKFKEANVATAPTQNADIFSENDIFSEKTGTNTTNSRFTKTGPDPDMYTKPGPDPDMFYTQPAQGREILPRYDTSEEALLDEIAKEYEL